jgi:hypothetical protein
VGEVMEATIDVTQMATTKQVRACDLYEPEACDLYEPEDPGHTATRRVRQRGPIGLSGTFLRSSHAAH